jgi:two-component system chemotaxis response regulator CheY
VPCWTGGADLSRTALIVDDSTTIRQMVALTLTQAGFTVLEGEHGQAGLAQLDAAALGVDLIVTDLNMPVMDGLVFVRELRSRPRYRFTPVLFLTTESAEEFKRAGRTAGATGWLLKPFDPQQLLQVVARVVQ